MSRVVSRLFTICRHVAVMTSVAIVAYVAVSSTMSAATRSPRLSELPVSGGRSAFAPAEDVTDQQLQIELDNVAVEPGQQWAVVEFADFECPYCGSYARETFPLVKREYVDTGKVAYVFRHFPLARAHPHATAAAEAAECARSMGRFWPIHERLFLHQQALDRAALQTHAAAVGLPAGEFELCTSGEMSQRVRDNREQGLRLGVKGTPTFLIGRIEGRRVQISHIIRGAAPFAAFQLTFQALEVSSPVRK